MPGAGIPSAIGLLLALLAAPVLAQAFDQTPPQFPTRTLDDFEDPGAWTVITSNQVSGSLRSVDGVDGRALCLDYDFNGVSGYAGLQRKLPIEYPADYQFSFQLRGDSPANDLQFKLIDASGDNVWWVNRPEYDFPEQWTPVTYKKRHISRAWGPAEDPALQRSAAIEFTINNNAGGAGTVCFDSLSFRRRVPDDGSPLTATATASPDSHPGHAVDGDPQTVWAGAFDAAAAQPLTLDLGRVREFGGLVLHWADDFASDYAISVSDDGQQWRQVRQVNGGNGGHDWIALAESEARYIRLTPLGGPGERFALAEAEVKPLAFAATPNDFIKSIAAQAPRGQFPRGFIGEQPYWTIVGIDGGAEQGLIGEDGAIELARGDFRIEPFVLVHDKRVHDERANGERIGWADVQATQTLQDGYLPIPSATWQHDDFSLTTTAFARGTPEQSQLVARYRLTNTSEAPRDYTLALALRPFQVNPPSQFLSTQGGISPIHALAMTKTGATVDGDRRVTLLQTADSQFASTFAGGMAVTHLMDAAGTNKARVEQDPTDLASGAWRYRVHLQPGESREFAWIAPLTGDLPALQGFDAARAQAAVAAQWHDKLDRVKLQVPPQGQRIVDTLRTALAHMLISRQGPRLQPGTRSYARTWIRDAAMIAEGLLRLGRADVAEAFLRWYAPYQFDNGKVPCCVDDRGSDPVPENDSHGELIFTVAEVYRFTGDRQLLEDMWPHVVAAVEYMDTLRLSERTEANRKLNPAFYGMMPASISHEGYSAKPMHSYWDNFWALRGYKDAVKIAQWLGHEEAAERFAASRDQFRADLYASIEAATEQHDIDYIPGSAELGDFDPTSTTIALAPGGEQGQLPETLLRNTFERYWQEFVARRDGTREWDDYTPYELRNVCVFVRLGWRERAHQALDFFFEDRQPEGWNQWGEVVSRTPREPFFLGDLPHAWVESDYARAALDLFAYARDMDDALVIAAGIPGDWLAGEGVAVEGLRTPYGTLRYALRREGDTVELSLSPGLKPPPGGVVLSWPFEQAPGDTLIDGEPAQWRDGELRIDHVPAQVMVDMQ